MSEFLQRKLRERFGSTTKQQGVSIVLPRAFITKTTKAILSIPAGAAVIAERNVQGNFALLYWDSQEGELHALAKPADIELDDVYQESRAELLAKIDTHDLEAELARRKSAESEVAE